MNRIDLPTPSPSRMRTLVAAVAFLVLAVSAFASPSTNIAPSSMFRPRGMVRIQVGAAGPDYWVADGASGFCRLDSGKLNVSTCFLGGTSEPYDDRPNSPYVFVADATGTGVNRITFKVDPTNPTKTTINTVENVLGPASGITFAGAPAGKLRTESAKIGPDGNLYVVFFGDANIVRVTNPRNPAPPSPAIQKASIVALGGGREVSMAWLHNDLWLVQAGFLERIQNATACTHITLACSAQLQLGNIQFPMGMAADPNDASQRYLYFSSGSMIIRLDTTVPGLHEGPGLMQIWSQRGILGGIPVAYSLPRGLNIHPAGANGPGDPGGDIFITDDITIEAPAPEVAAPLVRTGRAWLLPNPVTPDPGIITSPVGTGTPFLDNFKPKKALNTSVLRATGITHPRGIVFLGTHFWVSDEVKGFCRIDAAADGSSASLTNCYKPNASFIPGQPAADFPPANKTTTTNVYVPDVSGSIGGIARFVFNPVNETVSQSGVLSQGRGSIAAALAIGPEGSLYVGPVGAGNITKIVTPATAPSAAASVAATLNGQGVKSMVFGGFDLYLMENGPTLPDTLFTDGSGSQTFIQHAAPDLSRGHAIPFSGFLPFANFSTQRRMPAATDIDTPAALAIGPTGTVPCNSAVRTFAPTTPSIYLGGAHEVDQWSLLCTVDRLWVDEGQFNALVAFNEPIGVVTALGFAPDGTLAIGDDPTLDITSFTAATLSPTPGQGHIYLVLSQ